MSNTTQYNKIVRSNARYWSKMSKKDREFSKFLLTILIPKKREEKKGG